MWTTKSTAGSKPPSAERAHGMAIEKAGLDDSGLSAAIKRETAHVEQWKLDRWSGKVAPDSLPRHPRGLRSDGIVRTPVTVVRG